MYSYRLKAVKNYKEAFQLIYATKIERFNSRSYFYYIDNGIDPLTITVDLSRVPPIIIEGQSYTKLPKELWDRTEQTGRREQSHLIRTESPYLLSRVLSKGKERIQLPTSPSFQRQGGIQGFRSRQGTTTQVGEVCGGVIQPLDLISRLGVVSGEPRPSISYIDRFKALRVFNNLYRTNRQIVSFFKNTLLSTC